MKRPRLSVPRACAAPDREPATTAAALARRLVACLALAAAVVLPLAASAQEAANPAKRDKVTLQLKWRHQFQFAGYYAAAAKGYYREAGLDVAIVEAMPGEKPMQAVVDGKAEFGVGTTDLLLMRNEGIPVVVLGVIFQHSPLALMARKDSKADNIHALARGKLMIEPHSAELFAYLSNEGLDLTSLRFVEHDFDTEKVIDGTVDAMSVYSTDEPYDLMSRGIDYVLFKPVESGIDFYGDNLFTVREQIEGHPERVRAFVEASNRGWRYAMSHPREIAELIVSRYGTAKSLDRLMFEAETMQSLVLSDVVEVGYINPGRWERIAQKYTQLGMLSADIDLTDFIYNRPATRDFTFLYQLFAVLASAALILFGLVVWYMRLNERLQREVRERVEAQSELERLNAQKSLLLSIIGHDLRSPFNVLLAYGELLVAEGEEMERPRLAYIYENIRDSAMAAYTLLNNLLDWASVQTGGDHVLAETVTAEDLINEVVVLLMPMASTKSVDIDVHVDEGATIHADPRMVETVLRNLISNALKFTEAGGRITVNARTLGPTTEIEIADTGVGVSADDLDRLFEIEPKTPRRGTRGEQGSGLGLILCRDLVEANGGDISADSEIGIGTRVIVGLPATATAPAN